MINNVDGEFTDSNINPEKPDFIHLTNENFYLGFAIEDPKTYDTILDESIYYPKAYFKTGKRKGKEWIWTNKTLELEPCKLDKFGSKYKTIFARKYLGLHYCFKEMDEILEGHFSYDSYSMFFISLFPCKNTTKNNNTCKPLEEIDYYLKGTFFTMQFQDILLTPNNYNDPVKGRDQDLYTTVGKKLFKEFHVFFKITNIETDLDFIGIDEIKNVKNQKFIKYDSFNQMTKLLDKDVYETGESFCDITLKLSDLVFYQKRKYTKLLNILGDVGGLMEIVNTIFEFITSFIVDIIYETSLINTLFDLNKEEIQNIIFKKAYTYMKENKTQKKTALNSKTKKIIYNFDENKLSSKNTIENNTPRNNTDEIYYEMKRHKKKDIKDKKLIKHHKFCLYCCFLCYSKRNEENFPTQINLIKDNLDIITIIQKLCQLKKSNIEFEIIQQVLHDINCDIKNNFNVGNNTFIYHKN